MERKLSLNTRYIIVEIVYWAMCSILYSFFSVFLVHRGFLNSEIGIILFVGNLLATLAQPVVATLADKTKKVTLSQMTAIMSAGMILLCGLLYVSKGGMLITAVLMSLLMLLFRMTDPFVIAIGTYYIRRGYQVNYGVARGIGSLTFSVIAYLVGILIGQYTAEIYPGLLIGILVLLILVLRLVDSRKICGDASFKPLQSEEIVEEEKEKSQREDALSFREFCATYKTFVVMVSGVALLFVFHNMSCNYMYQIVQPLGGDASHVGMAMSIGAITELVPMFLLTRLLKKVKAGTLLRVAAIGFTIKAVLLLTAGNISLIYASMMLQCVGFALHTAASVYYVNEIIPEKDQVKGQAMMTTANSLGGMLGALLGGQLLSWFGVSVTLGIGTVISAVGTVIVLLTAKKV